MRKKLSMVIAMTLAATVVTIPVLAQEEPDAESSAQARPVAALAATGNGTVALDVERGGAVLAVVGDVTISGPADLDVRIASYVDGEVARPQSGGTEIVLTGFSGTVVVRGTDYTVDASGLVTLRGKGEGTAELAGEGLWRTRHDKGVWPGSFDTLG